MRYRDRTARFTIENGVYWAKFAHGDVSPALAAIWFETLDDRGIGVMVKNWPATLPRSCRGRTARSSLANLRTS